MDKLTYDIAPVSLPQVVIEPSPVSVRTESVMSVVRKIESIPEVAANGAIWESQQYLEQAAATSVARANFANGATSQSVQQSLQQAAGTSKSNTTFATGKMIPSQEYIVSVPAESTSQQLEDATLSTVTSQSDSFRSADDGCWTNCIICTVECLICYQKAWDAINSKYALPIWLLLLALPISAGCMGSLYMYSCPVSHSLPMLMFLIGICLMAQLSFRICLIIRIMTITEEEMLGSKLNILLLASTFFTIVFFITEAMSFWTMVPTTHRGSPEYCDPHFVTYSFWWNCVMSVVMVPLFLFPL